MNESPSRKRLGRGLATLLGEDIVKTESHPISSISQKNQPHQDNNITLLPITHLIPSKQNPRRHIPPEKLHELARSIRAKGLLQPILTRPAKGQDKPQKYEIIAGERRWRAAQMAQIHQIPAIVRNFSDEEMIQIALIENIQRQDINPLDEGEAYHRLIDEFQYSQNALAEIIGKSRSHIANMMRLTKLPATIKHHIRHETLSVGHARALIGRENAEEIAEKIIHEKLSVHGVEELIRRQNADKKHINTKKIAQKNADIAAFEKKLEEKLGMRIAITYSERKKNGKMTVYFRGIDQFQVFCEKLLK